MNKRVLIDGDELARLRRLAKIGAESAVHNYGVFDSPSWTECRRCLRGVKLSETLVHAHDCDAAIHLGLEREGKP